MKTLVAACARRLGYDFLTLIGFYRAMLI